MTLSTVAQAADGHCIGANACKGQSACKGGKSPGPGANACKGQCFATMSAETCKAAKGSLYRPDPVLVETLRDPARAGSHFDVELTGPANAGTVH